MHRKHFKTAGEPRGKASDVLIMVHGRGGTADDILSLSNGLNVNKFMLIAPQATNNSWYPYSFLAPPAENEPWLSSALTVLKDIITDLNGEGIDNNNIYFLGFSQGACLVLEFVTRNATCFGGVAAFTGGLIGDRIYAENYNGDFSGMPVFVGSGYPDPHVPLERINETVTKMESMNAAVIKKIYKNKSHAVSKDEMDTVNKIIF
jgi:phospholipase/carboxylesterase